MYQCSKCGHLFEEGEQKIVHDCTGEFWGAPAYDTYSVCPMCGGDYEHAKSCRICGGYDTSLTEYDVCDECQNELLKRFNDLIENNFSAEERGILNELLDGERI